MQESEEAADAEQQGCGLDTLWTLGVSTARTSTGRVPGVGGAHGVAFDLLFRGLDVHVISFRFRFHTVVARPDFAENGRLERAKGMTDK